MPRYDNPNEPYFLGEVIGSYNTYHRPTCYFIKKIAKYNYKRFRDWREAIELGFKPCKHCRPFSPPVQTVSIPTVNTPSLPIDVQPQEPMNASKLSDRRRELIRLLDEIDVPGQHQHDEGLAARISRMSKANLIPRTVAAFMRTITEMRNAAEYDGEKLTPTESAAVESAWTAVQEWALDRGITLASSG